MTEVTLSKLQDDTDELIDRVIGAEVFTVTRDGRSVALLAPLDHQPPQRHTLTSGALVKCRRNLPPMDLESLRRDLDAIIDPSL